MQKRCGRRHASERSRLVLKSFEVVPLPEDASMTDSIPSEGAAVCLLAAMIELDSNAELTAVVPLHSVQPLTALSPSLHNVQV